MNSGLLAGHVGKGAGSIIGVVRLCLAAADVAGDTAGSAVRLMTVAGRFFHIFGIVTAAVMLPLDIINVVWSSIELHNRTPSVLSEKIQTAIDHVMDSCVKSPNQVRTFYLFICNSTWFYLTFYLFI